jgi:hypothetical protein
MKWVEKNIITFKYKVNTFVTRVVIFCLIFKTLNLRYKKLIP